MPATVPDVEDEGDDDTATATDRPPAAPTVPCLFPCPFFHV